jgi:hypothetical protein
MKKLLLTAAAILATLNMYGQGSGVINFGNLSQTDDRRIWVNTDGGTTSGVRATGTGFKIALYFGQQGTPEAGLTQIGAATGFFPAGTAAGTFSGGNRTVTYQNSTVNGDIVTVQARAWSTIAGVPDTYEAVLALGLAGDPRAMVGKGQVFDEDTFRPGDPTDPATPIGTHAGWRGFGISPVPEPSVIGLGLLGAGALLMLRRRK